MRLPHKVRRGATAVEMAVVLGLTFLILAAIFEYGRYIMVRQLVDNAAREGARMAAVATNDPSAPITDTVLTKLCGQLPNPTVAVYWADVTTGASVGNWYEAPYGAGIAVRVTANYTPMIPTFGILPNPLPVSTTIIMRSEDNRL